MYRFRILKKALFLIVAQLVKEFPVFFEPDSSFHYESLPADLIPSLLNPVYFSTPYT